jgi:hypothetical protein
MSLLTFDDFVLTQILLYGCENLKPLLVICKRINNIIQSNNILKILVKTGLNFKEDPKDDDDMGFPHEFIKSKAIDEALKNDNVECLKFVHKLGHSLEYVFLSAVQYDSVECVKYLLTVESCEDSQRLPMRKVNTRLHNHPAKFNVCNLHNMMCSPKCLKYFIETNRLPPPEDIELGKYLFMVDLECIKMLYDYGARYHKDSIIEHGEVTFINIDVLKFAHEHGHPKTLPQCVGYRFEHLKYYYELGCQLGIQDVRDATSYIESVKYLHDHNYKFPDDICDDAAQYKYESLKFLHEHGYKITQQTLHRACLAQDEKSMEYIHKLGFPLTSDMYEEVLRYGYIDTPRVKNYDRFYYLLNNGCPITKNVIELLKDKYISGCFGDLYQVALDAYNKQKK